MKTHFLLLARLSLAGLMLAGVLAGPRPIAAQQPSPITLSVRAGFDGYYKDGRWLPVRITLANDGPDVSGTLKILAPRNDGLAVAYTRDVELPTLARREFFMYIPMEGYVTDLTVRLLQGNTELAKTDVRLTQASATDLLYGVLANSPSAFNNFSDVDPLSGAAYVAQIELADLPPAEQGWQPLDALIVSDVDTGALSPEQHAALAAWVAGGGRLLVAGGPGWQKTAAGLSDILPLAPTGAQTLTDLSALGTYAASAAPDTESAVVAVGVSAPEAVVWAATADGLPLVLSRRMGYGQTIFFAADPAFAPLKGWDGLTNLFRNAMAISSERPSWAVGMRNWYSARDAVNALPGLNLPATWQICGFLGLYIVLVGPVNYLVLRRLKRREWAWLTVPGIVILFSAATYLAGYQLRGTQATLHQLSVVQVWPGADWARVDMAMGLFSPRRTNYDLEFAEGYAVRPMPSDGSYGMLSAEQVQQGDRTRVMDVRVDVGAVQAFIAQGKIPAPQFDYALTLDLSSATPTLAGTITNRSGLALKDAVVLGPGAYQTLGDFAPNETKPVSLSIFNSRAAPAVASVVSSITPPLYSFSSVAPPPYYGYGGYDPTIDNILGTASYYDDRETFRRYSLLSSIIDNYGGNARGNGVFLVGWTDTAPVSTKVLNRSFKTADETVYIIALPPELDQGAGPVTLPPGLMNWTVLDPGTQGSPTPYDMYIYTSSDYALRFMPAHPLTFAHVESLTLHITSYGTTGPLPIRIDLWDFAEGVWREQTGLLWGDNAVTAPARFVNTAGEVHIRVSYSGPSSWSLEAVDCTLVVER